jgi:hypothetical protein
MISSEVQRTLVKSPPELWAELSDPAALARHLGELGEIRIVRTEPESKVEWTAENTTGTVSIKPSGWGTKVTLSVTRESEEQPTPSADLVEEPPPEPAADAELPAAEPPAAEEPEATMIVEAEAGATSEPAEKPEAAAEPDAAVEAEPRRGFFSRLFGRRRRSPQPELPALGSTQEPDPGQSDPFETVRQALAPEAFAAADPFAVVAAPRAAPAAISAARVVVEPGDDPGPAGQLDGLAAELMAAEDVTAEQVSAEEVTAVLTAVLDRLGAAHHRPFSRS